MVPTSHIIVVQLERPVHVPQVPVSARGRTPETDIDADVVCVVFVYGMARSGPQLWPPECSGNRDCSVSEKVSSQVVRSWFTDKSLCRPMRPDSAFRWVSGGARLIQRSLKLKITGIIWSHQSWFGALIAYGHVLVERGCRMLSNGPVPEMVDNGLGRRWLVHWRRVDPGSLVGKGRVGGKNWPNLQK